MRILHDEHVRQLAPWVAVDAARRGLLAAHAGRLTSPPSTADADITVHCSVGLAGTEVLLGARLLGLGP